MMSRTAATTLASFALASALALASDAATLPWELVARSGDEAPGLSRPAHFSEFTLAANLGPGGRVVFGIPAPSVIASGEGGVYAWTHDDGLTLLAAFGTTPDAEFLHAARVVQGDDGDIALLAVLSPNAALSCGEGIAIFGPPALYSRVGTELARVATAGDAAPGALDAWVFANFADAIVGATHSLFYAGLAPDACDVGAATTLFRVDQAGTATLIARRGMPAPGAAGGTTIEHVLPGAALADDGRAAFLAKLSSLTAFPLQAIYGFDLLNVLAPLVVTGSPTAMAGDAIFDALGAPVSNGAGELAFFAILDDGLNDFPDASLRGLWVPDGSGGNIEVFRAGDTVPGGPMGSVFADLHTWLPSILVPDDLRINASGEVAFADWIEVTPGLFARGVFGPNRSGTITLRMQTGNPAPSIAGATLSSLQVLGFSDDRRIAVLATLIGPGVEPPISRALYLIEADGAATLLHNYGDLFEFGAGQLMPTVLHVASFDRELSHVALELRAFVGIEAVFTSTLPEPSASMLAATVWLSLVSRWPLHQRSS